MDESEQVLLQRAKTGDKDTYGQLCDKYAKRLYDKIFIKIADGNHHDTENILQEVFIRGWKGLKNYKGTDIWPWFEGITGKLRLKTIRDKIKHRGRESSFEQRFTADKETAGILEPASDELPPDEMYCRQNQDEENEVIVAIKRLPLPSRAVLTLKFLGKRTMHISDMLPKIKQFADTEDKVKKLLVQARKELKLELHKRNIYIKT